MPLSRGVRTEDSQSSNPGSIPGSATIQSSLQRNLTKSPTKQKELPVLCDSFYETRAEKTLLSNDNAFYRPFSPGAQERSEFCKPTWRIIGDHKPKSLRTGLDFPVVVVPIRATAWLCGCCFRHLMTIPLARIKLYKREYSLAVACRTLYRPDGDPIACESSA